MHKYINKKYVTLILVLIITLVVGIYINLSMSRTNDVVINYLSTNKDEVEKLENMDLSIVYGNVYEPKYVSYNFKNKNFKKEVERFFVSIQDTVSRDVLDVIFSQKKYDDILQDIGQVNFYKVIDDKLYIIFDGAFTSTSKTEKDNIIYEISLKDGGFEIISFVSNQFFFAKDIYKYDNIIYVAGTQSYLNEKTNTYMDSLILYTIDKETITNESVLESPGIVKIESFMFLENTFIFSTLENDKESLYSYNLEKREIQNIIGIEKISQYIQFQNVIYLSSYNEEYVEAICLDKDLNVIDKINIDVEAYTSIKKVFIYEQRLYFLLEKNSVNHVLYVYNEKEKIALKLIEFTFENNPKQLFLYDLGYKFK